MYLAYHLYRNPFQKKKIVVESKKGCLETSFSCTLPPQFEHC